ncbi:GNAT family N-acetyltransferase [Nostocoides sp. F2B08]|uniref:GNAT family N-acetyltransferase n=1 Tax=Nostocoides sp. F2B08 TaxID=2653936 RepID=UPI00186B454A|nr:GNAT family N-acetyltransferase [Tetrasphaera sp. F2B08]
MGEIEVRQAEPRDSAKVTALLRASLGKEEDSHYEGFLAWKHERNAFGRSPAWVALDGDRVVGYRTLLRWRFQTDEGKVLPAVRAVDTATDPDYRGRGIFRLLTLRAVADLTVTGDAFVFNTPNDKSRPGYLSMGWTPVRRLPVGVLPSGPGAIVRMTRSKVASRIWSEQTDVGVDARDALADDRVCDGLLAHAPQRGVRTERTPAYLRWRTEFEPLAYRVLLADPHEPKRGGAIFRVRERGAGLEAVIAELFAPSTAAGMTLVRRVLNRTGADYAIGLRTGNTRALLPLPGQGPLLTARPLARGIPAPSDWSLTMGDVELF